MSGRRRLFVALYAASGAAALIYEVTWTRLLTLLLGHTIAAASAVLAAMMGGLAIGAWLAGRFVGRHPVADAESGSRLRLYAALELVVDALAVVLPYELILSTPMLRWAYADGSARALFGTVRVAITLLLVGTPAVIIGGALLLARSRPAAAPEPGDGPRTLRRPVTTRKRGTPSRVSAPSPGLAVIATAISGFSALVYEVAWTRLLAVIFGPTTYAFSTMTAADSAVSRWERQQEAGSPVACYVPAYGSVCC